MNKDNKAIRKKLYVKLYYSMLDWEWYDDANTFRVFMHLMLIANRNDQPYHGDIIHRGEALASNGFLAKSLNISVQNVKTALNHLQLTGEITKRKIHKTSVIRLNNYNKYQSDNRETTPNQPRTNHELTSGQPGANREVTTLRECNSDKSVILKECVKDTHAHGTLNNVFLTDDEYTRFTQRYPLIAQDIINQLSEKIATGDPKYQTGHIGHLYQFARYHIRQKTDDNPPSYDIELALQRALNIDPNKQ